MFANVIKHLLTEQHFTSRFKASLRRQYLTCYEKFQNNSRNGFPPRCLKYVSTNLNPIKIIKFLSDFEPT